MPRISIQVKDNEAIERALKRFKNKFERAGILREYRRRTSYTKASVLRRNEYKRAVYRQKFIEAQM